MTGTIGLDSLERPKRYGVFRVSVNGESAGDREAGFSGLYEVGRDRLRMTFPPPDRVADPKDVPKELVSTPKNESYIVTYERVKPDRVGRWLDLFPPVRFVQWVCPNVAGPHTLNGWSYTLNLDLSVTITTKSGHDVVVYPSPPK